MVRAGNRFGKSWMGCAEDIAWLIGERPWYAKDDPARTIGIPQRPIKLLVITTDWEKVDEVFTSIRGDAKGKIWKFLPPDLYKGKKVNHMGIISEVILNNGSLVRFDTVKSWMQNPQSGESVDWDAIHVDEPCPEGMWKGSSRGLMDRDGSAWFTLTPLSEPWIQRMFFGDAREAENQILRGTRKAIWATSGSTYDNKTLSEEAIKEFESTLTEDERQCRMQGIPLYLSGLVYKEFDFDKHVLKEIPFGWEAYNKPPKGYTVYTAIDPHPQTPHAVLFIAVSPQGYIYVFDEIFHHTTIDVLTTQIKDIQKGYNIGWTLCDPIAYINDPRDGSTIANDFGVYGLVIQKATKDLQGGILRVKQELKKDNRIFVSPECRRFIYEINNYSWQEKDNKPSDVDDHMMENFYRLLMSEPIYFEPTSYNNNAVEDTFNGSVDFSTDDLEE